MAQPVVQVAGHALALTQRGQLGLGVAGMLQLRGGGAQLVHQPGALLAGAEAVVDVEVEQEHAHDLAAHQQAILPGEAGGQPPLVGGH